MEKEYKTSEAKRRSNRKYINSHIGRVGIDIKKTERALYEEYAAKNELSLSRYIRNCIKYCIDNNIDVSTEE